MSEAVLKGSAVNPYHYRQAFVFLAGSRRPYVEVQTVFAHLGIAVLIEFFPVEGTFGLSALKGGSTKAVALLHSLPRLHGLRLFPTQLAHRRSGIGDAFVDGNALFIHHAFHLSAFHIDYQAGSA